MVCGNNTIEFLPLSASPSVLGKVHVHVSLTDTLLCLSALKRKYTKEERDLRGKYKLLARLMDAEEYEKFIGSLKREKQLRQRVKELSRYRKNGITKMEGQC